MAWFVPVYMHCCVMSFNTFDTNFIIVNLQDAASVFFRALRVMFVLCTCSRFFSFLPCRVCTLTHVYNNLNALIPLFLCHGAGAVDQPRKRLQRQRLHSLPKLLQQPTTAARRRGAVHLPMLYVYGVLPFRTRHSRLDAGQRRLVRCWGRRATLIARSQT